MESEGKLEDLCRRLLKMRELRGAFEGLHSVTLRWDERGWIWGQERDGRKDLYAATAEEAVRLMMAKIIEEERAAAFSRRESAKKLDALADTLEMVLR